MLRDRCEGRRRPGVLGGSGRGSCSRDPGVRSFPSQNLGTRRSACSAGSPGMVLFPNSAKLGCLSVAYCPRGPQEIRERKLWAAFGVVRFPDGHKCVISKDCECVCLWFLSLDAHHFPLEVAVKCSTLLPAKIKSVCGFNRVHGPHFPLTSLCFPYRCSGKQELLCSCLLRVSCKQHPIAGTPQSSC